MIIFAETKLCIKHIFLAGHHDERTFNIYYFLIGVNFLNHKTNSLHI